jgi:hypothetical protein
VSQGLGAQRIAEWLIRLACRRLPADVRAERCREWAAELPAILDDPAIRPTFLRTVRALAFCIGISRTTRQLSRSARAGSRPTRNPQWRTGAMLARPTGLAVRTVRGLAIWLVIVASVITLLHMLHGPHTVSFTLVLALAIGFDMFCLRSIARATRVRYLPKWLWVLICLMQTPGGGIIYLSIGHIYRARPQPPAGAKQIGQ